jgi:acyl-CoA reductase-like NAD-dependent aldehyde dehydrogenase
VASPATADDVERAVVGAAAAAPALAATSAHQRSEWLFAASARLAERREELARLIAVEARKPIRDARGEATRAIYVFRWAAEECKRLGGEWMPLDTEPGLGPRMAVVGRAPIGPIVAITPFNFPLNLVAHKVAPALAAGNPVIVKPASVTPGPARALVECLLADPWPAGSISVLELPGAQAGALVADRRVAGLTFTGSDSVGWALKAANPKKRVTLELGGNAAVLIEPDAELVPAAERLAFGSFAYAGQVCISTQRILVHERVLDPFLAEFVPRVEHLRLGDPLEESTDVGPMIATDQLERVDEWVREAVAAGARVLTGGERRDPFYTPTVLAGVPTTCAAGTTRSSVRWSRWSRTRPSRRRWRRPTRPASASRRRSSRLVTTARSRRTGGWRRGR